jgi:hypothetical protein
MAQGLAGIAYGCADDPKAYPGSVPRLPWGYETVPVKYREAARKAGMERVRAHAMTHVQNVARKGVTAQMCAADARAPSISS